MWQFNDHHTTTVLRPFFWDHPGEPLPEENFWTLWCKGRLTEADTLTIQLGATPSGLTSAHLHNPPMPTQVSLIQIQCCGTYRKQPFSCLEADQKTVCPTHHWQRTASEDYTPLISVHTHVSNNLTVYRNERENTAASFINATLCRLCMGVSVTVKIWCPMLKCPISGWNLIIQKINFKITS